MIGLPGLSLFSRVSATTGAPLFPKMRRHFFQKCEYTFSKKWTPNFGKSGSWLFRFLIFLWQEIRPSKFKKLTFPDPLFQKSEGKIFRKVTFQVVMGWVAGHVFGPLAAMGQDTHSAAGKQSGSQQPHDRRTTADQTRCPGGLAAVLEPRQHEGPRFVPLRSAPHGWHINGTQPQLLASKGEPCGCAESGAGPSARSYIDFQQEMSNNL